MRLRSHFSTILLACLPLGFVAAMVVAPLLALVCSEQGGATAWNVLQDDYLQNRMIWTLTQAVITCVLTLLLSVPTAWVLARLQFVGRRWILRLLMLPFVMPTLVAGMGVLALFGANGLLWAGWQDTPYLLIYGNVFFNLPVLVRAAYQGFLQVPQTRLQTAQTLGANQWQQFCWIEWPVLRPWLAGGACLVFLYCFSGFGLALLLGGNRYATIEVEIYQLIAYELDMTQASVLVWLVLVVTAAAGLLYAFFSRGIAGSRMVQTINPKKPKCYQEWGLLILACLVLLICCVLPLLAVFIQSLEAGASWQVLQEEETLLAAWNTLRFSAMAVLLSAVLGVSYAVVAKRWMWVRTLTFIPFMVSPVCVAFGVLVLYPDWTASLPLLIATYGLLAYPFVAKDVLAAWDALPENYPAAARSMGANGFQTAWYVLAPLLKPAIRRGLTLAAATCVGEFAATLFLSRPEWQTLTTLIYKYLGHAGADNYQRAMVLSSVLMAFAVVVFICLDGEQTEQAE